MTFAYDICTYLASHSYDWDSTVIDNGFEIVTSVAATSDPRWQDIVTPNTAGRGEYASDIIYLNQQPNTRTNCICVFDSGGYEAERYHGSCRPMERPTIQIKVRHESLQVAEDTAFAIYRILDELYSVTVNSHTYLSINAVAPPYYLGLDNTTTSGQAHSYTLNLYGNIMRP